MISSELVILCRESGDVYLVLGAFFIEQTCFQENLPIGFRIWIVSVPRDLIDPMKTSVV